MTVLSGVLVQVGGGKVELPPSTLEIDANALSALCEIGLGIH